jgi:hypothetical protein
MRRASLDPDQTRPRAADCERLDRVLECLAWTAWLYLAWTCVSLVMRAVGG